MKIENKALVKHEIRNIWPAIVYIMGCMSIGLWKIVMSLNESYIDYLSRGYSEDIEIYFLDPLRRIGELSVKFLGIGVVLLLYLQFKDNKSLQVSSFIKSLPYTNKEIYKVKLQCGLLTLTGSFVFGVLGVLGIRSHVNEFLTYIEKVSLVHSGFKMLNSLSYIMLYLFLIYATIIFLYLFGFWMQYLVSNNVASIVVSGLVLGAIPFIVGGCMTYLQCITNMKQNIEWVFDAIIKVVCPVMYLNSKENYYNINNLIDKTSSGLRLVENHYIEIKLIILLVLIGLLILAIAICNKNYKTENQESFISVAWAERVFKVGVVISCIGVVISLVVYAIGVYTIGQKVLLHVCMIVAGIAAYKGVCKICTIGKR